MTRVFIPPPCTDTMRICGIIAEYDPFHNGHAWQMAEARRLTGADYIVCVMSGCFTQRGMPALLPPHARAEMALRNGADIVLQMPVSFSLGDGERFAAGGVHILRQMGAEFLCFGAEPEGISIIADAARFLEQPDQAYTQRLHVLLDSGLPFPAAQGAALAEALHIDPAALALPNTALAICYARANLRLNAGLQLVPVPRRGRYHDAVLHAESALPSATAVREALMSGKWEQIKSAVPDSCYPLLQNAFESGGYHAPEALDQLLRWTLRESGDFANLPNLSEGLENRLPLAADACTRDAMIRCIKSKRYSYARISRLMAHALLHTEANRLSSLPEHAYILGFRKDASSLLHAKNSSSFSLWPSLPPGQCTYDAELDARADALWALGANQPFGTIYRKKPVILP